jgi:hypothetical protein
LTFDDDHSIHVLKPVNRSIEFLIELNRVLIEGTFAEGIAKNLRGKTLLQNQTL